MKRHLTFAWCLALLFSGIAVAQEQEGWPRERVTEDGTRVTLFQPQMDNWENYQVLTARLAMVVEPPGSESPIVGGVRLRARTKTDFASRTVLLEDFAIEQTWFPTLDEASRLALEERLRKLLPTSGRTVLLDRLLAAQAVLQVQSRKVQVSIAPPVIYHSTTPAILVSFDGAPVFEPIEKTALRAAVNTNWDIAQDPAGDRYYLLAEPQLLEAPRLTGPWTRVDRMPEALQQLSAEARELLTDMLASEEAKSAPAPRVFYSSKPAELIVTDGPPILEPIPGTGLMEITNTASDVFFTAEGAQYYHLVAGRWFRAPTLEGPWSPATDNLPAAFAKIPPDHPRAHVLASVPGTPEAGEAVIVAHMPRQAVIKRDQATFEVTYDGTPAFATIEGTTVEYAINTAYAVLRVAGRYYACHRGAWFEAQSANGPWSLCDNVPAAIYGIPPTSRLYPVTYVWAVSHTDEEVVFVHTGGYFGVFPRGRTVVYGTGQSYEPYVSTSGEYVIYYPSSRTYGGGVRYDRYATAFVTPDQQYGPRLKTAVSQFYSALADPAEVRRRATNLYAGWGDAALLPGLELPETTIVERPPTPAPVAKETPVTPELTGTRVGDLYVGVDGNVYKQTDEGWMVHLTGNWQKVEVAESPLDTAPAAAERPAGAPAVVVLETGGPREPVVIASAREATGRAEARDPAASMEDLREESKSRREGDKRSYEYRRYVVDYPEPALSRPKFRHGHQVGEIFYD